ncbi:MAG: hypothetical protein COT84_00915 [Chlamydiae bacterium CG10_big_fil_rev_8_21_14_0_10_35_9]|nr:MAG: hypothetical protein COT84_00915 [Chlamydiae bacterium CG10_big_fil_rev_8_21_14_0_10_35_9]
MTVNKAQKESLIKAISEVLNELNHHNVDEVAKKISSLKRVSKKFSRKIQEDIILFCTQVDMQKDYRPQDGISEKIRKMADKILKDL